MSGFNTIKKSRKRSHEIEEKLNVLNRELEKTKDIQEQPTMSTGDLYTPVVATLPQDPVQVDNPDPDPSTGATTDNWTQPVGDGEDGGTAGSVPDSFPFIVPNPGYQDPTAGWYAANGEPLYSEEDLPYDIPDASETGGIAALGGVQREKGGGDPGVINGYLRRDVSKDNFNDVGNTGATINGVNFKTHPHLFKPIKYWVSFSIFNPFIDAYWPNNSLGLTPQYTGIVAGAEDSNPRALFTAYKYVGGARTQTFDPVGSRGETTAGDPKGTGDADQYPPLNWFERLGREAFERLKDFAEAVGDFAMGEPYDIVDDIKDAYGYRAEIAISALNDKEFVRTNEDVTDREKEDLKNDLDVDNIVINEKETGYSDKRFYEDEDGEIVKKPKNPLDDIDITEPNWQEKITPEVRKKYEEWQKVEEEHPDNTDFVSKVQNQSDKEKITTADVGGLAGRGQAHHEFVNPTGNNEDAYYHYKDYAYAASDSKDPAEFPNPIDAFGASVVNAVSSGSNIKDKYGEEITGMSVVEVKIPYSEWTKEMKDSFNERKSGNKNESLYLKVRKNLKENTYMALLDRTYKPTERDYVKYAMDTADGRKQFDKDIKMVHEFIKKNPDKYQYVLKRYPKDDPRLSMLNYKMDRMTEASDKYLETQFPTNQDLFTKVKERTKKNMNLTDPKNFKPVKDPIKYVDVKKTKKLKETVTRHFNKPVKSKSMFGLNMSKVKKTNQKMVEKREQEQRVKEEEKAYIQEKMSRQKSNWKDDLTEV